MTQNGHWDEVVLLPIRTLVTLMEGYICIVDFGMLH